MTIKWTDRARNDIRELKEYIARDSPTNSRRFVTKLVTSVEKLDDYPGVGRAVPEAGWRKDIREIIFHGYRIIYVTGAAHISILAVVHGRRIVDDETLDQ